MHEALANGRKTRLFNVIDDYHREVLGIEIDFSLPSTSVIRTLAQIIEWRGVANQKQFGVIMVLNMSTKRLY